MHPHRSSRFSMLSRAPTLIETFPRSVVRLIALLAMKFHLSHREAPAATAASSQPAYAKCPADYAMPCHTWVSLVLRCSVRINFLCRVTFVAGFALLDPTGSKPKPTCDRYTLSLSPTAPQTPTRRYFQQRRAFSFVDRKNLLMAFTAVMQYCFVNFLWARCTL